MGIDVSAGGDQAAADVEVIAFSSEMQWCVADLVEGVEVEALREEATNLVQIAVLRGGMKTVVDVTEHTTLP